MSAPGGKYLPVGLRLARAYALNTNGVPAATSTTVYEGVQIAGAKAYEISTPDARRIVHTGDDRILAQDVLPRQEVSSGTLRAARNDHDVYAVLTGTKAAVIGESSIIGYGTDKQGSEPSIGLLLYQQAKEVGTGVRSYRGYIVPVTQAIINPASLNENAPEFVFNLLPSAVDHHLWGIKFAAGVEGYTQAESVEMATFDLPHVAAWKADGVVTEFAFHADRPAVATAKIHAIATISPTGVVTDVSATAVKAVDKLTIAGPLAANTMVVCYYEYAD